MPCARSRSSWMVALTSSASWSSIVAAVCGSSVMMSRVMRRCTASATRCCCAPSCRSRSTRRRSASALATILERDWRSSSAWLRSSSRVVASAVSSRALWVASPTWRASSVSTRSSSAEKVSAAAGRRTTMRPSSSPAWLTGATRIGPPRPPPPLASAAPSCSAGSHTDAQAWPDTPGSRHYLALPVPDDKRPRARCRAPPRSARARPRCRCRPRRSSASSSFAATRRAEAAAHPC